MEVNFKLTTEVREVMKKEVYDLVQMGIIERCRFPYSSPVVRIPKKDSTIRFCVDYRKINLYLNKYLFWTKATAWFSIYIFSQPSSSKFFTKIDLTKGYWQIPLSENTKNKTAFVTPDVQFRFLYLPFGLICAPGKFTFLMRKLFLKRAKCHQLHWWYLGS